MKYLLTTAAIATLAFFPATASAQLIGGFDNNTVLGGAVGAGLGGVIGSQIAPSGNRTEGTAIGAVVGGLAGAAYGNSQSSYYGNPYAGQFNPGFNGRNLAGTALGAGLGGAIGSNLAGSGQREEGTAIGAVLGGLAGYSLANRTANGRSNARYGGGPVYNAPAPYSAYGGGYVAPASNYNVTLPGTYRQAPNYQARGYNVTLPGTYRAAPAFAPAPQYVPGGYVAGPIIPVTTYTAPRVQPVQTRIVRQRIRVEPEIVHRERIVVDQPCPSGTTQRSDGSCLSAPRVVHAPAPTVIPSSCPSGTMDQGNGTCLAPAKRVVEPAPVIIPSVCPSGTTDLGNGTCQEPPKTILGSAPVIINQACPSGTTDLGNGTCEAPARIVEQAPVYVPSTPVTPTCPSGTYYNGSICLDETPTVIIEETINSGEYCYGDGKRMYDETGRVIPGYRHDAATCKNHH